MGMQVSKGDVKNADELCVQPVEELRRALRLKPGQCVKLLKAIYGLAEAPRYWWRRCHKDLLSLGWESVVSEPCLYTYRDKHGTVIGMAVVYVDDIMVAFRPENKTMQHVFEKIQGLYDWGMLESRDFGQSTATGGPKIRRVGSDPP